MTNKKTILLKLTGEALPIAPDRTVDGSIIYGIAQQIKQLNDNYLFGIVIGGGNIFRGAQQGSKLGMSPSVAHQAGILATAINGLIIEEMFTKAQVKTKLFCAARMPMVGGDISQQAIDEALQTGYCPIFTGGIATPFFTTDTTAVVRALQIKAYEVWKGTTVDGICTDDPKQNPKAELLKTITYKEALSRRLTFMDTTALYLAQEHKLSMRFFNIFEPNALIQAAENNDFGSIIHSS